VLEPGLRGAIMLLARQSITDASVLEGLDALTSASLRTIRYCGKRVALVVRQDDNCARKRPLLESFARHRLAVHAAHCAILLLDPNLEIVGHVATTPGLHFEPSKPKLKSFHLTLRSPQAPGAAYRIRRPRAPSRRFRPAATGRSPRPKSTHRQRQRQRSPPSPWAYRRAIRAAAT
jgi:hypothetical protein